MRGVSARNQRSAEAAEYRVLYKRGRWQVVRMLQLAGRPMCEPCGRKGRVTPATVVHHKRPHKGDPALFYDTDNLESACKPCHDGPLQQAERIGYSTEIGADGWPLDGNHPINRVGDR